MKTKKMGTFVLQCIKAHRNKFIFGYPHRYGHYVTDSGSGSFNLRDAFIFNDSVQDDNILLKDNPLLDLDIDSNGAPYDWKRYYKCVPVNVTITKRLEK